MIEVKQLLGNSLCTLICSHVWSSDDRLYVSKGKETCFIRWAHCLSYYNIGQVYDPMPYEEAISSEESIKWVTTMEEGMTLMHSNDVCELWDLQKVINGYSKPKKPLKGRLIHTRLVVKKFIQRDGINFT